MSLPGRSNVESSSQAMADTAVDGVILTDAAGTVLMFNPACEKLFGYPASEVVGRDVRLLMPSPYQEEHDRYVENDLRTHEPKLPRIGREVVGRRKDGSTFPMEFLFVFIISIGFFNQLPRGILSAGEAKQAGESIFVGIIHDLTERKRTVEQMAQVQKMEIVSQLSGGIAH